MLLLLLPISVLGFRILTPNISTNKSQKRIYMVLCFLSVLFFVGLRSINTGSIDTQTYCRMFDTASSTSGFIDFLTIREISIEEYLYKEGNFYLLVWLISRFTDNAQIFLVVITAIMTACVFKFISEHSEDLCLKKIAITLTWPDRRSSRGRLRRGCPCGGGRGRRRCCRCRSSGRRRPPYRRAWP